MRANQELNCIVVGYNDIDFTAFADKQKKMEHSSGAYHEIKANSALLEGRRYTYMDLINRAITRDRGEDPGLNVFDAPALGACYLKSVLHRKGFHTEVVSFFTYGKEKLAQLLTQRPQAVAITTTFYIDYAPIIEIIAFVRRYSPETKVIVGGPYVFNAAADLDEETLAFLLQQIGADIYIIDSQGERTLAEVLGHLRDGDWSGLCSVPNLLYASGGAELTRTPRRPENNDLAENTVDWSLFDPAEVSPLAYLRTARSCPFSCSFCNYPTLAGKHVVDGVENVEKQLRYLHSIGTSDMVFIDDTFNVPLPRFKNILRMMVRNKFNFRWISFFRCSNADEEAFDLMRESGCVGVLLGIESGDQQILKYMNKAATVERYLWGIGNLTKRGIVTFASIICGFPGETQESVMNSLRFIEEAAPTFFNVQLYFHDRRSPIHARAAEFQIQGAGYNWQHRTMNWREATECAKYLFANVQRSGPLPLYNFSLWGISYLLSRGITLDQIKKFSYLIKPMLLGSLDDVSMDFSHIEEKLTALFATAGAARSHIDMIQA